MTSETPAPDQLHLSFTWAPTDRQPMDLAEDELLELAIGDEPDEAVAQFKHAKLVRYSFDGRRRSREWRLDVLLSVEPVPDFEVKAVLPAQNKLKVVIVGSGPTGLFAALELAAAGIDVTVLERGFDVQRRRKDLADIHRGEAIERDSNYCHGEGGAGTYSDGKLYTRSARAERLKEVLRILVDHGAPSDIEQSWRPHIGSNRLPKVVTAMRETIEARGGRVVFGARVEELLTQDGKIAGVRTQDAEFACDAVIMATGHSALDSLQILTRAGVTLEAKGFAMGVRVEHPQPWLDGLQYGGLRDTCDLPASFFELVTERKSRGVYSFCMCPGGFMVPSSTSPDRSVINGMSLSRRDSPFANSGIVVAIEPEDLCGGRGMRWGASKLLRSAAEAGYDLLKGEDSAGLLEGNLPEMAHELPLIGIAVQRALEFETARLAGGGNRAPAQRADFFAAGHGGSAKPLESSYQAGLVEADLARFLPRGMSERLRPAFREFDESLPGFAGPDGQVVGIESRSSSPVRVPRDGKTLESPDLDGLYPAGEGAGYAGGIISAAIDGMRVARAILKETDS